MGTVLQIVIKTLRSRFGHLTRVFIRHRRSENSPFIMKNYPADVR